MRFSVVYTIFNFAFVAGRPPHYLYFPAMVSVVHLSMAAWRLYRKRHAEGGERDERAIDARGHLLLFWNGRRLHQMKVNAARTRAAGAVQA